MTDAHLRAEIVRLSTGVERGDVDAMARIAAAIAAIHAITVDVRTRMPAGVGGLANWQRRAIVVPPIDSVESFAVFLHEAGHILAGPCTDRTPHRRDHAVREWHRCLACEVDAWERAMALVPFTRAMHGRLRQCLATYRRTTIGPKAAVEALDAISGTVTWARAKQARVRFNDKLAFVERLKTEAKRERRTMGAALDGRQALVDRWRRESA
jgi:hypothetical protein